MEGTFQKRLLLVLGIVALAALAILARHVLALLFTGFLLALALSSAVNLGRKFLPFPRKLLLVLTLLAVAGLGWLTIALVAPKISRQFSELAETLPRELDRLSKRAQNSALYEQFSGIAPEPEKLLPSAKNLGGAFSRLFMTTFDAVSGFVLVLFVAIFIAANPAVYRNGLVRLIPPARRRRANEIIDRCIYSLKHWLLGQGLAMVVVGVITGASLAIAGIPMAAALGVLAAVFEFIPFLGPILSGIPAVLLAAGMGSQKVWIVLAIYLAVQFVEGNLLQPIVQQKAVELPPVITLVSIVIFGAAFGILGMLIATPAAAVLMILVQEIYVKDVLKDSI